MNERKNQQSTTVRDYSGVIDTLERRGYIPAQGLATNVDIDSVIEKFVPKSFQYEKTNIGNENTLREVLTKNPTTNLIIPLLVGSNHWVLLTRQIQGNKVTIECWDPVEKPETQNPSPNAIQKCLKEVVRQVYSAATTSKQEILVSYTYGGEQKLGDAYSCGARVARKALEVVGAGHGFRKVSIDDPRALNVAFVNCIIENSVTSFDKNQIDIFAKDTFPIFYREDSENSKTISQIKSDESLAIYLQEAYIKNPDSSWEALQTDALTNLAKATEAVIAEKGRDMSGWTFANFFSKLPTQASVDKADKNAENDVHTLSIPRT
ncbi:MAG: hypothetical protein H0U71_09135 [Gammaproteobacteria bacterium]|nr:hypothetical protein [Gammaproteobacteria bacterium]